MTQTLTHVPDPTRDLLLERVVDVPKELVWKAWTTPEILMQWFTPVPWKTVQCDIDLRPGGAFNTVMMSPEGERFPHSGCFLEIVENQKLVWTSALAPGYRPHVLPQGDDCDSFAFTAVISLEDHEGGTKYSALVIHGDAASSARHAAMGFHDGWGTALTQLVQAVKALPRS